MPQSLSMQKQKTIPKKPIKNRGPKLRREDDDDDENEIQSDCASSPDAKTIIDHYSQKAEVEIQNMESVCYKEKNKHTKKKQSKKDESEEDDEEEKTWIDTAKDNIAQIFKTSLQNIKEAEPSTILIVVVGFFVLLLLIYLKRKISAYFSSDKNKQSQLKNSDTNQSQKALVDDDANFTGFKSQTFSKRMRRI